MLDFLWDLNLSYASVTAGFHAFLLSLPLEEGEVAVLQFLRSWRWLLDDTHPDPCPIKYLSPEGTFNLTLPDSLLRADIFLSPHLQIPQIVIFLYSRWLAPFTGHNFGLCPCRQYIIQIRRLSSFISIQLIQTDKSGSFMARGSVHWLFVSFETGGAGDEEIWLWVFFQVLLVGLDVLEKLVARTKDGFGLDLACCVGIVT